MRHERSSMSALADALVAAQRRAVAAIEKQYAAGRIEPDVVIDKLNAVGLTDTVDQERLLAALDTIMEYGAALPAEPQNGSERPQEPATDAQRARIKRDIAPKHGDDAAVHISSEPSLTKAQASEIIDSIAKGTFELEKWWIPF